MWRTGQVCDRCPILKKHLTALHPFVKGWDWGTHGKYHLYRCLYADIEGERLVMRETNDYRWDRKGRLPLGQGLLVPDVK
eukprot:3402020-Karenia_brevis.AAC.1